MNKYFEKVLNILGFIIGCCAFFLENSSLQTKFLVFSIIMLFVVLISYIHSALKCHKLIIQNNNLIQENNNLKEQLSKSNQKISLQDRQLDSYRHSNDDDENRKITII